ADVSAPGNRAGRSERLVRRLLALHHADQMAHRVGQALGQLPVANRRDARNRHGIPVALGRRDRAPAVIDLLVVQYLDNRIRVRARLRQDADEVVAAGIDSLVVGLVRPLQVLLIVYDDGVRRDLRDLEAPLVIGPDLLGAIGVPGGLLFAYVGHVPDKRDRAADGVGLAVGLQALWETRAVGLVGPLDGPVPEHVPRAGEILEVIRLPLCGSLGRVPLGPEVGAMLLNPAQRVADG